MKISVKVWRSLQAQERAKLLKIAAEQNWMGRI